MQYNKMPDLNRSIDSAASMTCIDFIEHIAQKAIRYPDVYIKPGHNGPYYHPETVLRNKGHWLIIFCKLYEWTGNNIYKQKAAELADYLMGQKARPFGYSFYHRNVARKDRCNGLIGQAWTFEALAQAAETFQEASFGQLAEEVFLQHHFNEKHALWNILEINGKHLPIDYAFNHQLWFAATMSLVKSSQPIIQERIALFLDKLMDNATLMENGLIYHEFDVELTDSYAKARQEGVKTRLRKQLMKMLANKPQEQAYGLTPAEKKEKLWSIMKHKSIGYHAFNTYAFALLKQSYPEHALWSHSDMKSIVNYLSTEEYREGIEQNKYSFAYNPPGFEVPFSLYALSPDDFSSVIVYAREWINRQISITYNANTHLFDKNNQDPLTLTARLYEVTRLSKEVLSNINIEKL